MAEEQLLSAGKIAEKLGASPAKVAKYLKDNGIQADQLKGRCGYYGPEKVRAVEEGLKNK